MNGEKTPLISIIVPSFNEEKNISRCLDSILDQTYKNFEVICVDDNSTDRTFEIIKEYSLKDSRIKPFKNPSKGVSSARNFGIENSCGDYIGFVDSDDFIQPQMYEFLLKSILENNTEISICDFIRDNKFNKKIFSYESRVTTIEKLINLNEFSLKPGISESVCNKLFNKKVLNGISFKNLKIGEDLNFCAEILSRVNLFSYINFPLYIYYENSASTCHIDLCHEKWFDLIEARFISADLFKKNTSNYLLKYIFLRENYRVMVYYRYGNINNKEICKKIDNLSNKYFKDYLLCKYIPLREKAYAFIFLKFSFLYHFYRKIFNLKNKE
ncbi:MAG: glycosyltransferase family 2 protein [Clostridia bacterium]|nr:glycosyltransferase family 2 protein [Clostridia bacterium]